MKRVIAMAKDVKFWLKGAVISLVVTAIIALMTWQRVETVVGVKHKTAISGQMLTISIESEKEITKFLQSSGDIVAVSAVSASLSKNIRRTIFFKTENAELQQIWDSYMTRRQSRVNVFAAEIRNDRIINVINGEFDCRPFSETIGFKLYPSANKMVNSICSISIPAGFDKSGDFVGFVNIFLNKGMTIAERNKLAQRAIILSNNIYRREIANSK